MKTVRSRRDVERLRRMIAELVAANGLARSYASFEAVDIRVLDIGKDESRVHEALVEKRYVWASGDGA